MDWATKSPPLPPPPQQQQQQQNLTVKHRQKEKKEKQLAKLCIEVGTEGCVYMCIHTIPVGVYFFR